MARNSEHEPDVTPSVDRRQRAVPTPLPPPTQMASHAELVLVATRLAAMEEQLTSYFAAMAAQANAARLAAETARSDGKADVEHLASQLRDLIDKADERHQDEQRALRTALDHRLAEFGSHQDWRVTELESRLEQITDEASTALDVKVESAAQALALRADQQLSIIASRLSEHDSSLARVLEHDNAVRHRINELEKAGPQRLEEINAALTQRMDERNNAIARRIDEIARLSQTQAQELADSFARQIETLGHRYDDRLSALEQRLAEDVGQRVAHLEATIGRVAHSVDEAMVHVAQRVSANEATLAEMSERVAALATLVEKVDEEAIDELREKMSNAVGEAMLVRIEMDRLSGSLEERFDEVKVRMSEVEAQVADSADVSTVIQLERLEELERAVSILDPKDFPMTRLPAPNVASAPTGTMPPPPIDQHGTVGMTGGDSSDGDSMDMSEGYYGESVSSF